MIFRISRIFTLPARLIAVLSLSVVLVACGGGSGGDELDGDLGSDIDPDFPEIGGGDDPDSLVDFEEVITGVEGCQGGFDIDSSTPDWGDNCQVLVGGDHATSSYAQGIQRIVFSRGFTGGSDDILVFADGIFGPVSEEQVRSFQEAQGIDIDGIVGPETWGELQDVLELLGPNEASTLNLSGVSEASEGLDGVTQFFQEIGIDGLLGGWTIATFPGSDEEAPFDIGPPL